MDKSGALLLIQHGYAAYAFSHLTYIVLLATFLYYVHLQYVHLRFYWVLWDLHIPKVINV